MHARPNLCCCIVGLYGPTDHCEMTECLCQLLRGHQRRALEVLAPLVPGASWRAVTSLIPTALRPARIPCGSFGMHCHCDPRVREKPRAHSPWDHPQGLTM